MAVTFIHVIHPHLPSLTTASDVDGLEEDLSKWDILAKGMDWKTDWAGPNKI